MSKADDGLRKVLQKHLPKPLWDWTVIETGATHQGVPDSYYTCRSNAGVPGRPDGWVECKATDGWAVKVEPHQVGWLQRHAAAGVRCTVATRARGVGSAAGHGDGLWLTQGAAAAELQDRGLQLDGQHVLGVWYGPPASWDWSAIRDILLR